MSSSSSPSDSQGMDSMSMVFTTDHSTPLFSSNWTPSTTGAYAGTCVFLILLAVIERLLRVWRRRLESGWSDRASRKRHAVVTSECGAERQSQSGDSGFGMPDATLTHRGLDEKVEVLRTSRAGTEISPWWFSVDLPRACVFSVQAGVGYLLYVSVRTQKKL